MTKDQLAQAKRRRSAIVAMRVQGLRLKEIAARFGMSVQRVDQILRLEAAKDEAQNSTDTQTKEG